MCLIILQFISSLSLSTKCVLFLCKTLNDSNQPSVLALHLIKSEKIIDLLKKLKYLLYLYYTKIEHPLNGAHYDKI